jgi:hypothetical protein|tara:strand:- start:111 stop:320 length:210 start_codon:yes stop_codon:yes gene_type:complete
MKTVARFATLEQAQTAKLNLGAAGIEAFIPDEMSAGIVPMFFVSKPGIRLQVGEKDEKRATSILDEGLE